MGLNRDIAYTVLRRMANRVHATSVSCSARQHCCLPGKPSSQTRRLPAPTGRDSLRALGNSNPGAHKPQLCAQEVVTLTTELPRGLGGAGKSEQGETREEIEQVAKARVQAGQAPDLRAST